MQELVGLKTNIAHKGCNVVAKNVLVFRMIRTAKLAVLMWLVSASSPPGMARALRALAPRRP